MYYLYADLGNTFCQRYADTEAECKSVLVQWLTNGAFPRQCVQVLLITEDMKQESCAYKLAHGRKVNFEINGVGLTLRKGAV